MSSGSGYSRLRQLRPGEARVVGEHFEIEACLELRVDLLAVFAEVRGEIDVEGARDADERHRHHPGPAEAAVRCSGGCGPGRRGRRPSPRRPAGLSTSGRRWAPAPPPTRWRSRRRSSRSSPIFFGRGEAGRRRGERGAERVEGVVSRTRGRRRSPRVSPSVSATTTAAGEQRRVRSAADSTCGISAARASGRPRSRRRARRPG